MQNNLFFLIIYYKLILGDIMNNKGFTLIEIISVISLLALIIIITIPSIGKVNENIKKSTLKTKIENIEQAAILYGQDHRENFNQNCSLCDGIAEDLCTCFSLTYEKKDESGNVVETKKITTIPVSKLLNPSVALDAGDGFIESNVDTDTKGYLEEDGIDESDNKIIINPLTETDINECQIQIYQKYGKIYAVYTKTINDTENLETCFYTEE